MGKDFSPWLVIVATRLIIGSVYRITAWITNLGIQHCFISAAFIGMAAASAFLIMIKWGKAFRTRSSHAYWRMVQKNIDRGMMH
jgi:hypothetical protein